MRTLNQPWPSLGPCPRLAVVQVQFLQTPRHLWQPKGQKQQLWGTRSTLSTPHPSSKGKEQVPAVRMLSWDLHLWSLIIYVYLCTQPSMLLCRKLSRWPVAAVAMAATGTSNFKAAFRWVIKSLCAASAKTCGSPGYPPLRIVEIVGHMCPTPGTRHTPISIRRTFHDFPRCGWTNPQTKPTSAASIPRAFPDRSSGNNFKALLNVPCPNSSRQCCSFSHSVTESNSTKLS